uniref:Uncharacterized protein n=1 Tax=Dunaliella tertiolecta TaxID=3047 RepID=A0A7S3R343_DUNTE
MDVDSRDYRGYGKSQPRYRSDRGGSDRRGSRPQPYDPQRDRIGRAGEDAGPISDGDESGQLEAPANSLKVGGNTDVRELANSVVRACAAGDPPALLTIGNQSVNQAVKGIAVACAELSTNDLIFQPAFRHANRTKPLIAFYLSRSRGASAFSVRSPEGADAVELTATKDQKIVPLAGAISNKVRENRRVYVLGIGADAVTNAILGIGNARLFLENDRLDIKILPEFVKIMKMGHEMNALRLNIIPERI